MNQRQLTQGLPFTLALILAGCQPRPESKLNQIKIQTGEQAPAIVIRSEGSLIKAGSGSDLEWLKPNKDCNKLDNDGGDIFLPENFQPPGTMENLDPSCSVYGWTQPSNISTSFPAWKAQTSEHKAIYLEGDRSNYPLGQFIEPADDIAISVSACTFLPNAGDTTGFKSCENESKDFFAEETKDLSPDQKKATVGRAILEALQVLTYNDAGLAKCYERSLLATDAIEDQFPHPFIPNSNIFRGLRQRSETMPISEDELAYLQEVIESDSMKETMDGMGLYQLRSLLALRLGYSYSTENKNKVPQAFEPFGDLTAAFEKTAEDQLKLVMGSNTERLSRGADNLFIFGKDGLETLLKAPGNEFFVAAKGQVDRIDKQSIKVPEGTLTTAKAQILADLLYRAVLLAKATDLDPMLQLEIMTASGMIQESCQDYAKYRPGLPSGRDQLIRSFLLNADLKNKPTVGVGSFKGLLIDTYEQPYKPDIAPMALRRSPFCEAADNPSGYCPMRMMVEASPNQRYTSLKVRVKNIYNPSNPVWEKSAVPVGNSAARMILISGPEMADLVAKGFFKSKTILPLLEIEGNLAGPWAGSDLLFSSKLNRQPVACGEYRIGDSYYQRIDNGKQLLKCEATETVVPVSQPTCDKGYSAIGQQCLKDCEGNHKSGETWTAVDISGRGYQENSCDNGKTTFGPMICDPEFEYADSFGYGKSCERKQLTTTERFTGLTLSDCSTPWCYYNGYDPYNPNDFYDGYGLSRVVVKEGSTAELKPQGVIVNTGSFSVHTKIDTIWVHPDKSYNLRIRSQMKEFQKCDRVFYDIVFYGLKRDETFDLSWVQNRYERVNTTLQDDGSILLDSPQAIFRRTDSDEYISVSLNFDACPSGRYIFDSMAVEVYPTSR